MGLSFSGDAFNSERESAEMVGAPVEVETVIELAIQISCVEIDETGLRSEEKLAVVIE